MIPARPTFLGGRGGGRITAATGLKIAFFLFSFQYGIMGISADPMWSICPAGVLQRCPAGLIKMNGTDFDVDADVD